MSKERPINVVCRNRRALHDYFIESKVEAGINLLGWEVKALRAGRGQLQDSYADFKNGVLTLNHCHIPPLSSTTHEAADPLRLRTLLVHRKEAAKLERELTLRGTALIPLTLYFKGPWAKVELALARGKKKYDKRESLKKAEAEREMRRHVRG